MEELNPKTASDIERERKECILVEVTNAAGRKTLSNLYIVENQIKAGAKLKFEVLKTFDNKFDLMTPPKADQPSEEVAEEAVEETEEATDEDKGLLKKLLK